MAVKIDREARILDLDPRNPDFVANPYAAYRAIREAAPVVFWKQYGFWCFFGYETIASALRDARLGRSLRHVASREELGWAPLPEGVRPFYAVDDLTLLEQEGPDHTRLRRLMNRAFVTSQITALVPQLTQVVNDLIDRFPEDGAFDLIPAFATPIPLRIITGMLGVPHESGPQLLEWSHRMVRMYHFGRTAEDEAQAVAATHAFCAFIRNFLAMRATGSREGLIGRLLNARDEGEQITDDELVANCILLLNAGHEATVHGLGNGIKAILESGLDPSDLLADEKATARTVEECLRFDTPLQLFTRYALEDLDIAGIRLGRGEKVGLLLGAGSHDPAIAPRPDLFVPGQATRHLAFGGGIHFCLGAPLARLEMQLALALLFRRCPTLRLAAPPVYANSFHFRGLESLMVRRA